MKKNILLLFLILTSFISYGQETFPRYYIESGDTIGVIYSIDQAQKIYNQSVLLELFKSVRLGCDSLTKKYFIIVNRYEQKQLVDKTLIDEYRKSLLDKDASANLMTSKIINLEKDLQKCDDQNKLREDKITNDQKIIEELKKQRNWLLGGSIGFGSIALFLLGAVLVN